jgi:hypothetical protein
MAMAGVGADGGRRRRRRRGRRRGRRRRRRRRRRKRCQVLREGWWLSSCVVRHLELKNSSI